MTEIYYNGALYYPRGLQVTLQPPGVQALTIGPNRLAISIPKGFARGATIALAGRPRKGNRARKAQAHGPSPALRKPAQTCWSSK